MNKYLKYTLRGFGILLSVLLILYLSAYAYVTLNRETIIRQVNEEVAKKLKGNVSIGNVDLSLFRHFPQISVLLQKISVTDTMFAQHKHTFFQAEEVYIRLSVINMAMRQSPLNGIRIEKGSIHLFTDTSGYTNKYLADLNKDTSAAASQTRKSNQLKDVTLKNVRFILEDQTKGKLHDWMIYDLKADINERDSSLIFKVKNDILVHSLAFNRRGSYIKEKRFEGKYELRVDQRFKQLQFDNIIVNIAGRPLRLTGRFDLNKAQPGQPKPHFRLKIAANLGFDFAKSLLTAKIAKAVSIVSLNNNLDIKTDIQGPLKGGEPLIHVSWAVKNSYLSTPFLDFENASFTGNYTNEVVKGVRKADPNSRIELRNFTANWMGLPVTSENISILNLYKPEVTCDLRSGFPLTKLNEMVGSNAVHLNSGEGSINLTYKGPIEKNNNTNSFINGKMTVKNGQLIYGPRDVPLNNVNGNLVFRNSDVFVDLQCVVMNNRIMMDGVAKNLLTLISTEPNKAQIDWNVYSPSLNLADFSYLLRPPKQTVNKVKGRNRLNKVASQIDDVLEKGKIQVSLKADKLFYKKFEAANALVNISLLQDRWLIHKASLDHAGGQMSINGELINQRTNYHQAKVNALLENVDVSKVFAAFNNFGQDGITARSLKGKLNSKVNVSFGMNNDGRAYPGSIEGIVDFSLKNGALIDYEPVQKLQNFLFQKRDFENIQFAELKDRLEIKNQEVKINRMEIQSNVFSMFVEGIYSMKGNTDLSIQVPLSNFKKREQGYKPENIGTNKKAGPSVYIRGRPGDDGNIKFKLDVFNKLRNGK